MNGSITNLNKSCSGEKEEKKIGKTRVQREEKKMRILPIEDVKAILRANM